MPVPCLSRKSLPNLLSYPHLYHPPAVPLSITDLLRKASEGDSIPRAKEGLVNSAHSPIQGACRATGGTSGA